MFGFLCLARFHLTGLSEKADAENLLFSSTSLRICIMIPTAVGFVKHFFQNSAGATLPSHRPKAKLTALAAKA